MTATALQPRRIERATTIALVARGASAPALPESVVGQVEGVALVYDVLDCYGTTFARGCLTRTVAERVALGKVKLYWDHGDSMLNGSYDTHLHIGTVREVRDQQLPDGTWGAVFRADLFDTEPGREAHEYLKAIAATGSETGVSIGMMFLPETVRAVIDGKPCERFTEVPLREISITGESAVPGTRVTSVRAEPIAATTDGTGGDTWTFAMPNSSTASPDAVRVSLQSSASLNYDPILRGIHAAMGDDAFRVLIRGILSGDAEHRDSADMDSGNAGRSTAGSSAASPRDATTLDSQPAALGAARTDQLASTEARMAFVRAQFPRLYPP